MTAILTTLLSFTGANGADPYAGLIADAAGDLFGTTYYGGAYGDGTVFELVNNGGGAYTPTTLLSFNSGVDGANPNAGLIADAAGDLFGTTVVGGTSGYGTVFELVNHGGGAYTPTTLLSFTAANGQYPYAGLIADAAGDLFGTTNEEGPSGYGTVFELVNRGGGAYTPTTLLSFNDTNGAFPYASLIADAAGDLFGTTEGGGSSSGFGTVFELVNHGGGAYTPTTLLSFNGTNGADPYAGLIADAAGDLFGITGYGGAYGDGTVFELVNNGGGAYTPTTLLSFNDMNGAFPHGRLIADAAGDLFGTTEGGGTSGYGTVFELVNHGGGAYTPTTLYSFTGGADGAYPVAGLIADAAGDLFGTTISGGASGNGTVFEIADSGFALVPTVQPDSAHVSVAGTVTATPANGVLANDTDPIPNDKLTVSAVDGEASDVGHALLGSYGALTLDADGSFSYVADPSVPSNIIAQDIFTYTAAEEAGGSATSTLTITITQPGQTYIAGTPGQALTSGNSSVLLDGSLLQNETISAGNGNDGVIAGSNDRITLGNGNDVVKAGDGETIKLGNGADTVTAGANSTITLGNGNDTVYGGTNDTITAGNGNDQLVAAPGDLWTVGSGNDTFAFNAGFGNNTITDFNTSHDVLQLASALFPNYAAVMPQQVGANTVITYDANDTITLTGVVASHLTASNFKFT